MTLIKGSGTFVSLNSKTKKESGSDPHMWVKVLCNLSFAHSCEWENDRGFSRAVEISSILAIIYSWSLMDIGGSISCFSPEI